MNATAVQEHITEELLRKLAESRFLNVGLMNRIEGRISSRDELERYVEVLVGKLEAIEFRSEGLIDRIDRMVKQLVRHDRRAEQQSES
jgi:hypothetical protein